MNLLMCGLPGSGKSTVCRVLAQMLGWPCLETDHELEKAFEIQTGEKVSCRQIHHRFGDTEFRRMEHDILSTLKKGNQVIDIGGGTLTSPANAQIVKTLGLLIYLKVDRDTVFNRLMKKGMPSYLDANRPYDSFIALANLREPLYLKYADLTVDGTDLTTQEIADQILERIK